MGNPSCNHYTYAPPKSRLQISGLALLSPTVTRLSATIMRTPRGNSNTAHAGQEIADGERDTAPSVTGAICKSLRTSPLAPRTGYRTAGPFRKQVKCSHAALPDISRMPHSDIRSVSDFKLRNGLEPTPGKAHPP